MDYSTNLMSETVVPVDLEVDWDQNVPAAVLVSNDDGLTVLAVHASDADADPRTVVFTWHGTRFASMGSPNDEALSGHRLFEKGMSRIRRLGKVENSELIATLARETSVHPQHDPARFAELTHHVLPLKECTVEVVASRVTITRLPGSTLEAAALALAP